VSYVHKHGMPAPDQASAKYPHGTKARYALAKCRCFKCKVAVSDYEHERNEAMRPPWRVHRVTPRVEVTRERDQAGNVLCRFCSAPRTLWGITRHENACKKNEHRGVKVGYIIVHRVTGKQSGPVYPAAAEARVKRDHLNRRHRPKPPAEYVSAAKVRAHLKRLQKQGIGVQSVRVACGVSSSVLDRMLRGMIKRTRRATEAKILAVDITAARGRAKIDGAQTWDLLDDLIARGFTRSWIARQLGQKGPGLQLKRHSVTGENARKVRELHKRLEGKYPPARVGRWAFTPPAPKPPTPQERLATRLRSWDADEFAVRFARIGEL
jgi:hypothetical protein